VRMLVPLLRSARPLAEAVEPTPVAIV
jgi:hypothetical protein